MIAGKADDEVADPGSGIGREIFDRAGSVAGIPGLDARHLLTATGVIGLEERADARFGRGDVTASSTLSSTMTGNKRR